MAGYSQVNAQRLQVLAVFIGSVVLVSLAGLLYAPLRYALAIEPRSAAGLLGIVTAPWVHANLRHLSMNMVPLLILSACTMVPTVEGFWRALVGSMLGAGIFAWLLGGPHTAHLGASGLVFGMFGYLMARGYYSRKWLDVVVAVPVGVMYGVSMLAGLLPIYPGVSWQSHVGGAIGGLLAARTLKGLNHE